MTLSNRQTAFAPSTAVLLIAVVLCLAAPATAAGQWVPAKPALVTLEAPAPPSAAPGGDPSSPRGLADAPSAGDSLLQGGLPPSLHGRLREAEKKRMSGRVLPYAMVGLVVGGLLGYAAHEDVFWDRDENACRDQDIPGCEYSPYFYTLIGAGLGLSVGSLIGYIRERP